MVEKNSSSKPHICPACFGQGEIDWYDKVSTSATPKKKTCVPCSGNGVLWEPPENPNKNWTFPVPLPQQIPWNDNQPIQPLPPVLPQPLGGAYDEFQQTIKRYLEELEAKQPKDLDEQIDDCLNNKDVKRIKL